MKKVIIIGGGIAGLTAGIFLQKAGFETDIYEKNSIPGGMCIGWKREGFLIDNCIHWLTGTRPGSAMNELWKEIGALGDNVELIENEMFFSSELDGDTLTFWRDLEKTRLEMLALSPEDATEINKFIDYAKIAGEMPVPADKPMDAMNPLELMKLGKTMKSVMPAMKEYGKDDLKGLANRFKHPLIKKAFTDYMADYYPAFSFIYCYGTIAVGNGDIPKGGSLTMTLRIADKYKELGGAIHYNSNVERVVLCGSKAKGIVLDSGDEMDADYVICACDTDYTFNTLLPESYMPKELKSQYANEDVYPVHSGFQIAYGVDGVFPELQGTKIFPCEEMTVGLEKVNRMGIHSYDYDPVFAPEGKTVLQTNFIQFGNDYNYWKQYSSDSSLYKSKKVEFANMAMERVVARYPFLEGKIHVIDTWTPITYEEYCHCYKGAYMSFCNTKDAKTVRLSAKIKGLDNVLLASQWQWGPGGLPIAATNGKFAAWRIIKENPTV